MTPSLTTSATILVQTTNISLPSYPSSLLTPNFNTCPSTVYSQPMWSSWNVVKSLLCLKPYCFPIPPQLEAKVISVTKDVAPCYLSDLIYSPLSFPCPLLSVLSSHWPPCPSCKTPSMPSGLCTCFALSLELFPQVSMSTLSIMQLTR